MRKMLILALLPLMLYSCAGRKAIRLFNGRNLDGWYTYLENKGKNNDPDSVFTVRNGMLHISGKEKGYLATLKDFRRFRLVAEFKWGADTIHSEVPPIPGTGIIYHVCDTCSDRIWPSGIECLLEPEHCGDFWLLGGVDMYTKNEWEKAWKMKHILRTENYENPGDAWNTIEIISRDDIMRHYINGKMVNSGEYATARQGRILIQSNGRELIFRKIDIYPY